MVEVPAPQSGLPPACCHAAPAGASKAHEWQPSQHCAAMVLVSRCFQGAILHPVWQAMPRSCTPCGHVSSRSLQLEHMPYSYPLTARPHPRETSWAWQLPSHPSSSVPRARIMHACAHESSWLLPTFGSLQQNPSALHFSPQ